MPRNLEIPNPFSNPLNDPTHLFLYSEDSIKYILKSCNYEIICLEKRGLYKDGNLLRNNKNLNFIDQNQLPPSSM